MLAAQVRSGRICAVGYQHVGQRNYQFVKHWICAGNLGRVRSIKGFGCWPRDPEYYGRNGWAGKLAAGDTWALDSPHNNALAHAVNSMCFFGLSSDRPDVEPTAVQAELYRVNAIQSADTAVFRVETSAASMSFSQ